jgi:Mn2+/Fe2+ NRAMP family transporter
MGSLANPGWLTAVAGVLAALIIGLNVFLIADLFL